MSSTIRTQLDEIARSMRNLHKLLLEHEQKIYEKTYGRIENPYQLLNLAMEDAQFAWLRALSGEMVHLDEVRLNRDGIPDWQLRLIGTRARALMTTTRKQTSFQQHLEDAKQEDPAIMLAAADLMKTLPPAAATQIFVSAEEQTDPKDTTPGAIRPGKLVPGFGDKGYYALGAILESPLGSPVPVARYSNEIVIGLASAPTVWTIDGERHEVDAWAPVSVNAGEGVSVSITSDQDGMLVRLFLRPSELGGTAKVSIGEISDDDGWLRIGQNALEESGVGIIARVMTADEQVNVPTEPEHDTALFVVAGDVALDGVPVPDSHIAIARAPEQLGLESKSDAMVLVIDVNPNVEITRVGTVAR